MLPVILASNGDAASANPIVGLAPFLLIGLVFYFLIIRPQRKRQQTQQQMVRELGVGDDIVTIGGFHGTIVGVTDDTFDLEIAPGTVVTIVRSAVARKVSPPVDLSDLDAEFDDDDLDTPPTGGQDDR